MANPKTSTRTFKYRIYPNRVQVAALELHLSEACRLYNAALQERRDAWKMQRKRISFYDQSRQLKDIRAAGDLGIASFATAERVLRKVERSFDGFFRRVKAGQWPGYPRFKSASRFDSLECRVGDGANIRKGRIGLSGVGGIKVKWHRQLDGIPKAITIRRDGQKWFVCVASEELVPSVACGRTNSVGIDLGLTTLATLSDGSVVENPRHFVAGARKLRRAQRALARCRGRSAGRKRVVHAVRECRGKVARQRLDAHHKASTAIVARYGRIAVEDLNIKGLARTRLAKSIHDAGWGRFLDMLAYKAESAGCEFVRVNPSGTSQTCLCGARVPKTLSVREHVCTACGLVAPRDLVSAQLIERLGRSRWSPTSLMGAVDHEA